MCGSADILVTDADIARRLDVSRSEARELSSQPGFPAALGVITASSPPYSSVPFWRWDDVDAWVRAHGVTAAPVAV